MPAPGPVVHQTLVSVRKLLPARAVMEQRGARRPIELLEQYREILAADEVCLVRVIQPIEPFFNEQRLPDAVRLGHVDMGERSADVTAELHESS
jgi:hypothetical protein